MGQISLPRLNRLNNSMFWESFSFFDNYQYNSFKLYVFYKYFLKYFFRFNFFYYSYLWGNNSWWETGSHIYNFTSYNNKKLYLNDSNDSFKILKFYLYTIHNKYYLFIINFADFRLNETNNRLQKKNNFFKKLSIYL